MLEMAHQMVRRKSGTPESVANFLPSEVKARHVYSSCALPANNTHIHGSIHTYMNQQHTIRLPQNVIRRYERAVKNNGVCVLQ